MLCKQKLPAGASAVYPWDGGYRVMQGSTQAALNKWARDHGVEILTCGDIVVGREQTQKSVAR